MLFLVVACTCLAALGAHQLFFLKAAKRRQRFEDWDALLASIETVNLEGIQAIANLFLNPTKDQLQIEPTVMWKMLGGLHGVGCMKSNAKVMLELCMYAEHWGQEGELIAQLVRTDAVHLNRAARRIERAVWLGIGKRRSHFALLEVAGYYDLIQRRLLGLYESTHVGRVPALQGRLGMAAPSR